MVKKYIGRVVLKRRHLSCLEVSEHPIYLTIFKKYAKRKRYNFYLKNKHIFIMIRDIGLPRTNGVHIYTHFVLHIIFRPTCIKATSNKNQLTTYLRKKALAKLVKVSYLGFYQR